MRNLFLFALFALPALANADQNWSGSSKSPGTLTGTNYNVSDHKCCHDCAMKGDAASIQCESDAKTNRGIDIGTVKSGPKNTQRALPDSG